MSNPAPAAPLPEEALDIRALQAELVAIQKERDDHQKLTITINPENKALLQKLINIFDRMIVAKRETIDAIQQRLKTASGGRRRTRRSKKTRRTKRGRRT